jgi:hypothetical protein
MLRFFAGVGSTLLFVLAGFFAWKSIARPEADPIAAAPSAQVAAADDPGGAGPRRHRPMRGPASKGGSIGSTATGTGGSPWRR